MNLSLKGQTNEEILLKMYGDTCNALINVFPSDTSRFYLSKYLQAHHNCGHIFNWMSSNNFDIKCKTILTVALDIINRDPAYRIERFIELDSIMRYRPQVLQRFSNEPDLIKAMEAELKSSDPLSTTLHLYGQSVHDSSRPVSYQDSCAMVIGAFRSEVDRHHLSAYLDRFSMCGLLARWMTVNGFNRDSKAYLMMAVKKIEDDPSFRMERFIELHEVMRNRPEALLRFQNEPDLEKAIEEALRKPEPIISE